MWIEWRQVFKWILYLDLRHYENPLTILLWTISTILRHVSRQNPISFQRFAQSFLKFASLTTSKSKNPQTRRLTTNSFWCILYTAIFCMNNRLWRLLFHKITSGSVYPVIVPGDNILPLAGSLHQTSLYLKLSAPCPHSVRLHQTIFPHRFSSYSEANKTFSIFLVTSKTVLHWGRTLWKKLLLKGWYLSIEQFSSFCCLESKHKTTLRPRTLYFQPPGVYPQASM